MSSRMISNNPAIARLVERQMRNWELGRDQRLDSTSPGRSRVEEFVCISRQVGTTGEEVAQALGDRLGWPVFDREILDAMAGDDTVRRQIYESMDERDLSWWEETLRSLMQSEFVRNDYFKKLTETLLSLARQGSCVFLGRGADLLLPQGLGLRVRLVAPTVARCERIAEIHDLTRREAEQWVRRTEDERRRYFQRHFGVEAEDPVRYDMTINLARLSGDEAVEVILSARSIHRHSS
jgi:cytidylate kinase